MQKKNKMTINYGWIEPWRWNLELKKLHKAYNLLKTKVKIKLLEELNKIKKKNSPTP